MSSAPVVMTTIAFVVALATALPPSTRPVNIHPALPVECRRDNGTLVEGLFPGGSMDKGCEHCDCERDGRVICGYASCASPRCADPIKGECCYTCPNGENCRTPSGKIIKDGETLTEDGMICSCSDGDYNSMWWDVTPGDGPPADCSPLTTVPPGCVMEDGSTMQLGEERLSPNGCMMCFCHKPNSPPQCFPGPCVIPPCVDPLPSSGGCCPTCPNGPNCRTKSGQIVGAGERVVEPDGRVCFCSMKNPEAVCSEPPRTTAPPSVVETCKLASGEIITKGKILKKDGAVCKCRRKGSGLAAVCIPTTEMEKMLKRLKAKLQAKKNQLSKKEIRKLNRRISRIQRQLN